MRKTLFLFLLMMFVRMVSFGQTNVIEQKKANKLNMQENRVTVLLETTVGNIKIALYNETPGHRDNFVKNVKEKAYDGVLFHRVINEFMVQTGDPSSKTAKKGQMLGASDHGSEIPAEFVFPQYFHKKGAIAAARRTANNFLFIKYFLLILMFTVIVNTIFSIFKRIVRIFY